jgi:protein ImuA
LALGPLHEVAGSGNRAIDGAVAALFAAGIAARTRKRVLWRVTRQDLFAPALAQAGLAPDRVIYVEAGDDKAVLACFEEALRHAKLGAIGAEISRLSTAASRRFQLAAEGCGVIGLALLRGAAKPKPLSSGSRQRRRRVGGSACYHRCLCRMAA